MQSQLNTHVRGWSAFDWKTILFGAWIWMEFLQ